MSQGGSEKEEEEEEGAMTMKSHGLIEEVNTIHELYSETRAVYKCMLPVHVETIVLLGRRSWCMHSCMSS